MSAHPFQHHHRVTYADCTLGNHVYYSRYLELIEAARNEFFRHLGVSFAQWQEQDVIFPVVECRLKYRAPARYDDPLAITVWVMTAHRARLNFGYRVTRHPDALILEAETWHVCSGLDEKPKRLPDRLIECLNGPILSPPPT